MRTLYIDCSMGCAGDMLTAALLELHPDKDDFLRRMNAALGGKAVLSASPDSKCGLRGTHVTVLINGDEEGEATRHHHEHTSISEILSFIDSVPLEVKVREDAKKVYSLIAEAESRVHGHPIENVHFHEVGSLDALADVLSVCALMHELAPERILASEVNVGSGTVRCAHGILPVPAPATELILRGVPIYSGKIKSELCTPTGAALLKYFVWKFGAMPTMQIENAGCGTGKKNFECANVVRAFIGETANDGEEIIELACNLDDMTPEELSFAMEELFTLGALDVYFTSIGMKKSRPGVKLTCMCRERQRKQMLECIFKHTTTLGVREYVCKRYELGRSEKTVRTQDGEVRVKTSSGYGAVREKAEYEDLAALARKSGKTIAQIRSEALKVNK
ncbi:MAG TPA: nickel pincer cofactor biosynthesis protein LarC [Clostridiales bacterium]|nr:nickel pincer cofactor biosynthesis protein LarC [Clostridiales bacterium]